MSVPSIRLPRRLRRHRLFSILPLVILPLLLAAGVIAGSGPVSTATGHAPAAPAAAAAAATSLRPPPVRAQAAYLLDADTGEALFEKFPRTRRPGASTTKIMTGLLAVESGRLNEVATVSRAAARIGEASMGLVEGEQLRLEDLLYGLLLNSGNDAAIVVAEHLAGSEAAFADRMNARAAQLELTDTQYRNPHGLHASAHYTSARDLAVLARAALRNPIFARVVATQRRVVPAGPHNREHVLRSLNLSLWWYPGSHGVKPGWTGPAGQVQTVAATRDGRTMVAVLMDTPDVMGELRRLLDYGFARVGLAPEWPEPDPAVTQAWEGFKATYLSPDGQVRLNLTSAPAGARSIAPPQPADEASADAQAAALLQAVWMRDRTAFDAIAGWTRVYLGRDQVNPANPHRDALFASRWRAAPSGDVTWDWNNSTAADQQIAAAHLLAARLWEQPAYVEEARRIVKDLARTSVLWWGGRNERGLMAPNFFLAGFDPMPVRAGGIFPAFYRLFAEATDDPRWLWLIDGAYDVLARATTGLGSPHRLPPAWFSVHHRTGAAGPPLEAPWQTPAFTAEAQRLLWHLALDAEWYAEPRARALLSGPLAAFLRAEWSRNGGRVWAEYEPDGRPRVRAESPATYGALLAAARIGAPELAVPVADRLAAGLRPAAGAAGQLFEGAPSAEDQLWAARGLLLHTGRAGNLWQQYVAPEDLPTSRWDAVVPPDDGATPWRYFEQTGHVAQGRFLDYFLQHGGLEAFGYPRTDELLEDGALVQYFQRARLVYHPEREGPGNEVEASLLGSWLTVGRADGPFAPAAPFAAEEQHRYFPETGHGVHFAFLRFYDERGGAARFGLPLSEEFDEGGARVQYFERARFEYHPELPPRYRVSLGLVGDDWLRRKGWLR